MFYIIFIVVSFLNFICRIWVLCVLVFIVLVFVVVMVMKFVVVDEDLECE